MAATLEARQVTAVYRRRLGELRRLVESATVRAWRGVDVEDIDGTLPDVLAVVEAVLRTGQAEAVRASTLYMSAFMTAELGEVVEFPPVDVTRYAGFTRDGRPVADVLALSSVSMKTSRGYGFNDAAVSAAGLARTTRAVRTETVDAARTAQRDIMAQDDRVSGFYRATSGEPCGACLGEAGRRFKSDQVFAIHGACQCTAEPIVAGLADKHRPPTGKDIVDGMSREQAEGLYGQAADGLLDGSLDPTAMVTHREAYQWGPMLFQTPVAKLTG